MEGIKGDGLENIGYCVVCFIGNYFIDLDWWGVDLIFCGCGLKIKIIFFCGCDLKKLSVGEMGC